MGGAPKTPGGPKNFTATPPSPCSPPCCLSRLNRKWEEKIPNPSKSHLFQVGSGGKAAGMVGAPLNLCPCPHVPILFTFLGALNTGPTGPGWGWGWGALRVGLAPASSALQTPGPPGA